MLLYLNTLRPFLLSPLDMLITYHFEISVKSILFIYYNVEYIPSSPRNVHARLMYDTVQVFWDAPVDNPDKVDVYHVYYKSKTLPKTFDAAVCLLIFLFSLTRQTIVLINSFCRVQFSSLEVSYF